MGWNSGVGGLSQADGDARYLQLSGGRLTGTLEFGADVNLYREAANVLRTDDAFRSVSDITARYAAAENVRLGAVGGNAGIAFGSAEDTNLYRSAASILKTDDALYAAGNIHAHDGLATRVAIGGQGPAGEAGLKFGSGGDTNLYRSAADTLKTDDSLAVTSGFSCGFFSADMNGNGKVLDNALILQGSDSDPVRLRTKNAAVPAVTVRAANSQTANIAEWRANNESVYSTISENGYFTTRKTSAPADAELSNGEVAFWFDATNGAAKLMVKAKEAGGTVRTGEVALT